MRIALVGYGKMGRHIESLALEAGHEITARITSENSEKIKQLADTDVAVEFTAPEAAVGNFAALFERGIPVVTGTTGWYDRFDEVRAGAQKAGVPFFYATNFSVGVHIALAANAYLAKLTEKNADYACSLEEWHHTAKRDAPSGTAITFAERIIENNSRYKQWTLTDSPGDADAGILPVRAYRENDIPGTHRVTYGSAIDEITLEHKAHNRDGFAGGALRAALWLADRKPGIYTMTDLLDL